MSTLTLKQVEKSYGGVRILKGIDLDVAEGEFIAILGPSGCGKSTLLRTIAGLEALSAGDILLDGSSLRGVPSERRNIAMVFQSYALYPHMTVAENMTFALRLQGVGRRERRNRAAEIGETLGLGLYLDRYPAALSGGQRQRVAIGRALIRSPGVFLFDEPLSNLDSRLRHGMRTELKRLHQRLGTTMVYITHDQTEAMTLADRIVVMREGAIEQVDRPERIYSHPTSIYVAGFVGQPEMNFHQGHLVDGDLRPNGIDIIIPRIGRGIEDRKIVFGIRPEDLRVASEPGDVQSGLPLLEGCITLVEPLGNETLLTVDLGIGEWRLRQTAGVTARVGDRVKLTLNPSALHLFDAASGLRLR